MWGGNHSPRALAGGGQSVAREIVSPNASLGRKAPGGFSGQRPLIGERVQSLGDQQPWLLWEGSLRMVESFPVGKSGGSRKDRERMGQGRGRAGGQRLQPQTLREAGEMLGQGGRHALEGSLWEIFGCTC